MLPTEGTNDGGWLESLYSWTFSQFSQTTSEPAFNLYNLTNDNKVKALIHENGKDDFNNDEWRKHVRSSANGTELISEPTRYGSFLRRVAEEFAPSAHSGLSTTAMFSESMAASPGAKASTSCTPLLVNLGPIWTCPSLFRSWGASMAQCSDCHWEVPPGLGLVPLHVIMELCARIHEHLARSSHANALLHCSTCSNTGQHLATFFAACHLLYSRNYTSVNEAVADVLLPPSQSDSMHSKQTDDTFDGNLTQSSEHCSSEIGDEHKNNLARFRHALVLHRRRLLPGQRRYCEYLSWVLHSPELLPASQNQGFRLRSVTFHRLNAFARLSAQPFKSSASNRSWTESEHQAASVLENDIHSNRNAFDMPRDSSSISFEHNIKFVQLTLPPEQLLLSIFCRGKELWSGGVAPGSIDESEDVLSFDVGPISSTGKHEGVAIYGDIVIAIWNQDHYSSVMWKPPKIAYAFHTAFVASKTEANSSDSETRLRIAASELDVPGNNSSYIIKLAEKEGFWMDISMEQINDNEITIEKRYSVSSMNRQWQETMERFGQLERAPMNRHHNFSQVARDLCDRSNPNRKFHLSKPEMDAQTSASTIEFGVEGALQASASASINSSRFRGIGNTLRSWLNSRESTDSYGAVESTNSKSGTPREIELVSTPLSHSSHESQTGKEPDDIDLQRNTQIDPIHASDGLQDSVANQVTFHSEAGFLQHDVWKGSRKRRRYFPAPMDELERQPEDADIGSDNTMKEANRAANGCFNSERRQVHVATDAIIPERTAVVSPVQAEANKRVSEILSRNSEELDHEFKARIDRPTSFDTSSKGCQQVGSAGKVEDGPNLWPTYSDVTGGSNANAVNERTNVSKESNHSLEKNLKGLSTQNNQRIAGAGLTIHGQDSQAWRMERSKDFHLGDTEKGPQPNQIECKKNNTTTPMLQSDSLGAAGIRNAKKISTDDDRNMMEEIECHSGIVSKNAGDRVPIVEKNGHHGIQSATSSETLQIIEDKNLNVQEGTNGVDSVNGTDREGHRCFSRPVLVSTEICQTKVHDNVISQHGPTKTDEGAPPLPSGSRKAGAAPPPAPPLPSGSRKAGAAPPPAPPLPSGSRKAGHLPLDNESDRIGCRKKVKSSPPPPPRSMRSPLKLRGFYWTKLQRNTGTVWQEIDPVEPLQTPLFELLQALFAVSVSTPGKENTSKSPGSARVSTPKAKLSSEPTVKLIDLPRANNISIMLTRFTDFGGPSDIRTALLTGSDKLTDELLGLLMQAAPNPDEKLIFDKYDGTLDELSAPERFLFIMNQVPRLPAKIGALMFRRQFVGLLDDAHRGISALLKACNQLKNSQRFRIVLSALLAVGNALNEGTARGDARGLKLESLRKAVDVKVTSSPRDVPSNFSTEDAAMKRHGAMERTSSSAVSDSSAQHGKSGGHLDVSSQLPPVRTLLDFVAWYVVKQYIVGHNERCSKLEDIARIGFLNEELNGLGDAIRRMQSDVLDALRSLERGMTTVQRELEAEKRRPCWDLISAPMNSKERQAQFEIRLEHAVERMSLEQLLAHSHDGIELESVSTTNQAKTTAEIDQSLLASKDSSSRKSETPFAALLGEFLKDAEEKQLGLKALAEKSQDAVADIMKWLGEGSTSDAITVFESVREFSAQFDRAFARMSRFILMDLK